MINIDDLLAKDLIPDALIRIGIRSRLKGTLAPFEKLDCEERQQLIMKHVEELKNSPIAIATDEANEQHYELPTAFFSKVLGPHLKYSSGYWDSGVTDIETSEARMLKLTCERAGLKNGDRILELGCGWGSLTLWMAKEFPDSKITAVSNSRTQRKHIEGQAKERGLTNLEIKTVNMITYEGEGDSIFDRVVSVEMFEHMKNYERLLANVARWLRPGGKLFIHIFTHHRVSYHFESRDASDWMSRYFFTGGQMPSHDLLKQFQSDLTLEQDWQVNGRHYQQTAEHWLEKMDQNRAAIMPLFVETYGADQATKWWAYWRVFYMSCAELWGYRQGQEWLVSHYRFTKP